MVDTQLTAHTCKSGDGIVGLVDFYKFVSRPVFLRNRCNKQHTNPMKFNQNLPP